MEANFIKSAVLPKDYPVTSLPEVSFVGRSNVGKSSLINKILNRKKLVKVGKTPGKTKLLNFFDIGGKYIFTDLPGYGYAKVSKDEKRKWGKMIEDYFYKRAQLKACVVLLDIRRTPSDGDMTMFEALKLYNIRRIIVLTKSDKISGNEIAKQKLANAERLNVDPDELIVFSATSGRGTEKVWAEIENICS